MCILVSDNERKYIDNWQLNIKGNCEGCCWSCKFLTFNCPQAPKLLDD
jgi:hypothetical protein